MTRLLTLLLLSLLLTPSARAQAMRPAPATTGPLIQQQPPSFPANPALTPAGAGASHGGLAAPGKVLAPRSPNKRLLPPTKEVGLWAADGAPTASSRAPALFDVLLPYPALAVDAATREKTDMCVESILTAAELEGLAATISTYLDHVKMCMAARAYALCASTQHERAEADRQAGGAPGPAEQWRITREHAKAVVEHFCPGSGWDLATHESTLAKVMTRWIARLGQYSWRVH